MGNNAAAEKKNRVSAALEHVVTFKHIVFALPFVAAVSLWFFDVTSSAASAASLGVANQIVSLKSEVATNKAAAEGEIRGVKAEVVEARKDMQGLYNYLLTNRRQPRLEQQFSQDTPGITP